MPKLETLGDGDSSEAPMEKAVIRCIQRDDGILVRREAEHVGLATTVGKKGAANLRSVAGIREDARASNNRAVHFSWATSAYSRTEALHPRFEHSGAVRPSIA
ncbi:hypothetical protein DKT77_19345 [Meridianimarinicoccus roseus]|uniref:Uncharacterized protein n=2 Tax=Meridianimarinicoccus roseus TaxID=2072018 RepID=A0A2V2L757_9RHOB|nr:hypothetical protein DKT77_19345 [Meridianimarinicoccus roseus]